jgi:hypothetical protein
VRWGRRSVGSRSTYRERSRIRRSRFSSDRNDNWQTRPEVDAITQSGLAPPDPNESALIVELAPGAYTAIVAGAGGTTGVALVEVYDIDPTSTSRLGNISTRGQVLTGANVMIGGFIVEGATPHTVLVRALGPTLGEPPFNVPGALGDPTVQLYAGSTPSSGNDDWQQGFQGYAINATGFPPPAQLESAVIVTLEPGNHTAIVSGTGGGTGVGLVEVYELGDQADVARDLFFSTDLLGADDALAAAVAADPSNGEAALLRALTAIPAAYERGGEGDDPSTFTDSFEEFLDQMGVSSGGRSLFDFTATFPDVLPPDFPTGGDIQEFLETVLCPAIDPALDALASLDTDFSMTISATELAAVGLESTGPLEVDYGDAKLIEAALRMVKGTLLSFVLAHDYDVDIDGLSRVDPIFVQQDILDAHPELMRLRPDGPSILADAKALFIGAVDAYYAASDYIRNLDDLDQSDDFFTLAPEDLDGELALRTTLGEVRCSLDGNGLLSVDDAGPICTVGSPLIGGQVINLSQFYNDPFDLRSKLPAISYDTECGREFVDTLNVSPSSPFPDPTLNGMLPLMTQVDMVEGLRPDLGFYAWLDTFFPWDTGFIALWHASDEIAPALEISSIRLAVGDVFRIDPSPTVEGFPIVFCDPDDERFYSVVFEPTSAEGRYTDTLIIESNDPNEPSIQFALVGCTGTPTDCDNDGIPDP